MADRPQYEMPAWQADGLREHLIDRFVDQQIASRIHVTVDEVSALEPDE